MSVAEKVEGRPLTLGEARQAVADARNVAAGLRARAASGERVRGAALAAADADVELADLALVRHEAEAVAEAGAAQAEALRQAVQRFREAEPAVLEAFVAGRAALRKAQGDVAAVQRQHAGLVAVLAAAAGSGRPPGYEGVVGDPVLAGNGLPPRLLEADGYRAVRQLTDPFSWLSSKPGSVVDNDRGKRRGRRFRGADDGGRREFRPVDLGYRPPRRAHQIHRVPLELRRPPPARICHLRLPSTSLEDWSEVSAEATHLSCPGSTGTPGDHPEELSGQPGLTCSLQGATLSTTKRLLVGVGVASWTRQGMRAV